MSLSSGCILDYFKTASVFPLLKNPSLDATVLVKILVVTSLRNIKIIKKFQPGFHQKYSTERALLKVTDDILMHADKGEYFILVLLDPSAAFNTTVYAILTDRLLNWVRISGTALKWFNSYLSD